MLLLGLVWVVLGLMVLLLLLLMLQPGGVSGVLMLMRKNVLSLRLKHDGLVKDRGLVILRRTVVAVLSDRRQIQGMRRRGKGFYCQGIVPETKFMNDSFFVVAICLRVEYGSARFGVLKNEV